MISQPKDPDFYGDDNDRMPAYHWSTNNKLNMPGDEELTLLVKWLRGEKLD